MIKILLEKICWPAYVITIDGVGEKPFIYNRSFELFTAVQDVKAAVEKFGGEVILSEEVKSEIPGGAIVLD